MSLTAFWHAQAEWSRATFGSDTERGPVGPLKHLAREVLTELLGIPREDVTALLARAAPPSEEPEWAEEYADLLFLCFDASRRAGLTVEGLEVACWAKLDKNKARRWGAPTSDEPVEHER